MDVVAGNGQEAVHKASAAIQPDLIIMDLMMPGMDGWGAIRRLSANENTKHIPIVLMTAHSTAGMTVVIRENCAGS